VRQPVPFGKYLLLDRISVGGMAEVFKAKSYGVEGFEKIIAIKRILPTMGEDRDFIKMFIDEAKIAGQLAHANICQIFELGRIDGSHFIAMEYIWGKDLLQIANRLRKVKQQMPVPMACFAISKVLEGLDYAHRKRDPLGRPLEIVHRDCSPQNVLVSYEGEVKVIDFGIAKATSARLTEKTFFTEQRALIGTPEYMSPEQADTGSADIDTRSDIYSLGVLLYELLTGVTPFDGAQLRSAAYAEVQRIIREVEPPKPSTRLSTMKDSLPSVAAQRGALPARLPSLVRGDLDWIVMKCLEKERSRRYDTAAGLALDVQRHLAGEPVVAAPPGALYRLRKFVRRRAGTVAAGAAIVASLVVGLGVALWQMQVASRERDAQKAATTAAQLAQKDADESRKTTEKVADFQAAQLRGLDAMLMGQRLREMLLADARASMAGTGHAQAEIASRQEQLAGLLADANLTNVAAKSLEENIFDRALKAAEDQFKDQPIVKARLLQTLATALRNLGLADQALPPQSEALSIRRREGRLRPPERRWRLPAAPRHLALRPAPLGPILPLPRPSARSTNTGYRDSGSGRPPIPFGYG